MTFFDCVSSITEYGIVVYSGVSLREEEAFIYFSLNKEEIDNMKISIEADQAYKITRENGDSLVVDRKSVSIEIDGNFIKIKSLPGNIYDETSSSEDDS